METTSLNAAEPAAGLSFALLNRVLYQDLLIYIMRS